MCLTYDVLYQDLQAELKRIRPDHGKPVATIEEGFQVSWRYRRRLSMVDPPVSQVTYYKKWLPLFDAEVRYYEYCYYVEQFSPRGPCQERIEFWSRELD